MCSDHHVLALRTSPSRQRDVEVVGLALPRIASTVPAKKLIDENGEFVTRLPPRVPGLDSALRALSGVLVSSALLAVEAWPGTSSRSTLQEARRQKPTPLAELMRAEVFFVVTLAPTILYGLGPSLAEGLGRAIF